MTPYIDGSAPWLYKGRKAVFRRRGRTRLRGSVAAGGTASTGNFDAAAGECQREV
jgi:hypothetical protein